MDNGDVSLVFIEAAHAMVFRSRMTRTETMPRKRAKVANKTMKWMLSKVPDRRTTAQVIRAAWWRMTLEFSYLSDVSSFFFAKKIFCANCCEWKTVHCIFRYLSCRSKQCIVLCENSALIVDVRIRQDWTSVEGDDQE
jgi:hypothetical protein